MRKWIGLLLFPVLLSAWSQEKRCAWPEMRAIVALEDQVCFNGEAVLGGGAATISLPPGFEEFTRPAGRTVQVTCIDGFSPLFVSAVTNGQFIVKTDVKGSPNQRFFWEVKAVRSAGPVSPFDPQK